MSYPGSDEVRNQAGEMTEVAVPPEFGRGIKNVMARLRDRLQPEPVSTRGQALAAFFQTKKYWRKAGMRMTDYVSVFDQGVDRMAQEGVDVQALRSVLGWLFLQMAGLTPDESYYSANLGGDELHPVHLVLDQHVLRGVTRQPGQGAVELGEHVVAERGILV